MPPLTIVLDPFYDGDAVDDPRSQLPCVEQRVLGNTGLYRNANSEFTLGGRPVGAAIGAGPGNLMATLIPRATEGGVPDGVNPHSLSGVVVHVDPHIRGQGAVIHLDRIDAHAIENASQQAAALTPTPRSKEGRRLRASATFQLLQGLESAPAADNGIHEETIPQQAFTLNAPNQHGGQSMTFSGSQPVAQAPSQAVPKISPLAAFHRQPPPAAAQPAVAVHDLSQQGGGPARNDRPAVAGPTRRVTFEMVGHGSTTVHYHDVIISGPRLILVYDLRFTYGLKHFPPAEIQEVALMIDGDPRVYLCSGTGPGYVYEDREFHELLIIRQAPMPEG